jgi:hypothetical protein
MRVQRRLRTLRGNQWLVPLRDRPSRRAEAAARYSRS